MFKSHEQLIREVKTKYEKRKMDISYSYTIKYQRLAEGQPAQVQKALRAKRDNEISKKHKVYDEKMTREINNVQVTEIAKEYKEPKLKKTQLKRTQFKRAQLPKTQLKRAPLKAQKTALKRTPLKAKQSQLKQTPLKKKPFTAKKTPLKAKTALRVKTMLKQKTALKNQGKITKKKKGPNAVATTQSLKQDLLKLMQKFVRLRDTDITGMGRCISCNDKVHRKQGDGGHYMSRSINSTAFDLRNINLQCTHCNRVLMGNMTAYREGMIAKYGVEVVEELEGKRHDLDSLDRAWLTESIEEYKKQLEELEGKKILPKPNMQQTLKSSEQSL